MNSRVLKGALGTLVLVLIAATAFAGGGQESGGVDVEVPDEFGWRNYEGTTIKLALVTHTWTDASIRRFEEFTEKTGIDVEYDTLPEEEYFDKLTMNVAAGSSEYDVFMTGAQQIWEFAPGGWMEPLDPYLENEALTSSEYDFDDFLPSMVEAGQWNLENGSPVGSGTTWALPWVSHGSALFYRQDIFEKHGLEPPEDLEELYDLVVELKELEPDMYPLANRGSRSWATIHTAPLAWFTSYGGEDFDEDLNVTINEDPDVVAAHELWGDILREGGAPNYAQMTWYEVFSDFAGGKAVMAYDADMLGVFLDQPANGDIHGNVAWTEPPGAPNAENASPLWIWFFAMNSNSDNKGAAWQFIQWVTGKEHLRDAAVNDLLSNPVRQSVWEDPAFRERYTENHPGYYETFQAVEDNSGLFYTPQSNFFEFTSEWAAAIQRIVAEDATAQEALDDVAERID